MKRLLALAVSLLLVACTDSSTAPDYGPLFAKPDKCDPWPECHDGGGGKGGGSVYTVEVSPADAEVQVGATVQLTAVANDRKGRVVPDVNFTWSSSDPSVAAVAAESGLVTGITVGGPVTITASTGGKKAKTGTASVSVAPAPPGTIVFRSDHDGNWELYSILSDGTNLRRLTQTTAAESEPAISADGRTVAYTSNEQIWLMDIDGGNQRMLFFATKGAKGPSWSPDGARLAISYRVELYYWPYTVTVSNRTLQQLPMGNTAHTELSWSHGDPVIAARYGSGSVAVFGVEQGGPTVLASLYSVYRPRFSPDGERIAFGGRESDTSWWDIYVMDADGQNLTRYATGTNDNEPTWSPDGRKIAFKRNEALWVMDADGTGATQLTYFTTGQIVEPSWYN